MREIEMKRSHGSVRALALFAYISVLIVSLSGCKDDKDGSSAHMGKVSLNLRADTTSLKKGIHSSVTKAVSDEFADFLTVDDYRILVVAGTDTAKQYDRFDKMPAEFDLPEGSYSLIASKGNNLPAEYENPYFEGSTDFTVKEGMSSPLDVTCRLGNARIIVETTDDFDKVYTDYYVDLKTTFIDSLFRIAKDEIRPAYLQVAKEGTDANITVYVKKAGDTDSTAFHVQTPLNLKPQYNIRLILKLSDGNQGIGLDVMLNDELTYLPIDTKIPEYMYEQMNQAKLLPEGISDGEEIQTIPEEYEGNAAVKIDMQGGVSSLIIKVIKGNEEPEIYDIATAEGAAAAARMNFSWSKTNDPENAVTEPLTDKWMEGYIFLNAAINSLKAPLTEDETYLFEFSGTDATGKAHETNVLTYTVTLLFTKD